MIPPTQNGNGIFIAHFQKMDKEETPAASESEEEDEEDEMLEIPLAAEGNKTAMTESAKKKKKIQKKVMMKPRNRFDLPEPRVIQRKVYHIKTTYTYDDDEEEEQEGGAAAYKNNGKGVFSRSSNNIRVFRGQESGAQGHQQQNTTKFSKRGVPRHVEERLSMLSLKSNSSASENEDGSKHGRKKFNRKRASKKEGTRRGGNGDSDDDGNDDEDDDEAAARNMSLGLYGIGLKRFYAPQFHAMAQLKKKAELAAAAAAGRDAKALYNSTSLDEPMRWRYPVNHLRGERGGVFARGENILKLTLLTFRFQIPCLGSERQFIFFLKGSII